ncbi:aspartyl-phosphate phosphatase Spo0E family protein [Crassaminicella thermophila]|uniref:Aspartyl-phosphate phosphatase Spo0E family protein n=1 Tax=Crassaminicella thermophila TaxID=2599308 RepID=A0A5C0SG39_CRATE|nr:aspartyl-phosphate phosphatase Spo0E family protein [Crassaminicella thermophila]QEK13321.1 aspartyl-phosphate phosphatase Spo0E family protein [Crassaminicella thermophila]
MGESKEIRKKIENLRKYLYDLIEQNKNLFAAEVVRVSQELDKVLNEYNSIIKKQIA